MNEATKQTQTTGEHHSTFRSGDVRYAVPSTLVKEVIKMTEPTPASPAPAVVSGVIALRGRVITGYDPRRQLNRLGGELTFTLDSNTALDLPSPELN